MLPYFVVSKESRFFSTIAFRVQNANIFVEHGCNVGCNEINFKSWYTKMPIEIENCRYLLGYK